MKLDYGTLLSPFPIPLSIGTIKKPRLRDIADPSTTGMTFDKYLSYQVFLKMKPDIFYTEIKKNDGGMEYWESLSDEQKSKISLLDIMATDESFRDVMLEVLQFFMVEKVVFLEGYVLLLNNTPDDLDNLKPEDIKGVLNSDTLAELIDILQQICCMKSEDEELKREQFKNDLAWKMYQKMLKGRKEREKINDINLTLPNLISAISVKHHSYNLLNIWDLTVFQLLDTFNRLQVDSVYRINTISVSVWGDEKKKFDIALWYRNEFDKHNQSNSAFG